MRFIYADIAAGATTASTSHASYPVANLADYNPTNLWKATATSATLTVTYANIGYMDTAIFNCNSVDPVFYSIYNGVTLLKSGNMEQSGANFWLDDPDEASATHINFFINAYTVAASAGVLRTYVPLTMDDPKEINDSYEDYSLVNMTRNQALNIRQKNRIWVASGVVACYVDSTTGRSVLVDTAKAASPYPMAVKVLETNYNRFMFAQLEASAQMSLEYDPTLTYADTNFKLTEVV